MLISVSLIPYSFTLCFRIVVFRLLDPLRADFELPSGPVHSWNPILADTCDGFMAARRLPRSVRRSAAPQAHGRVEPRLNFVEKSFCEA